MGEGHYGPPSNFASSLQNHQKILKITSLRSYDSIICFTDFGILYFWTDLAEIWRRRQSVGA